MRRFALLLALVIGGFTIYEKRYIFISKKTMVKAKVIALTYKPIKVYFVQSYNPHTKITSHRSLVHPAGYWVTVEYNGYAETLDDKDLYESVEIGDIIPMMLWQKYDDKGNLIKQSLKLIKE